MFTRFPYPLPTACERLAGYKMVNTVHASASYIFNSEELQDQICVNVQSFQNHFILVCIGKVLQKHTVNK